MAASPRVVISNSHSDVQLEYSASILAVLKGFHYDIMGFNGPKVHSLVNVMTMEKNIHEAFDRLELYFEATVSWCFYFSITTLTRCFVTI